MNGPRCRVLERLGGELCDGLAAFRQDLFDVALALEIREPAEVISNDVMVAA